MYSDERYSNWLMTWSDEAAANTASLAKCASQMYVSASAASTAVMFRLPTTDQQQHCHSLYHPTHLTILCSFSHAGLCVKYPRSISTIANKDFSTNSHSTTWCIKHLMNFESVENVRSSNTVEFKFEFRHIPNMSITESVHNTQLLLICHCHHSTQYSELSDNQLHSTALTSIISSHALHLTHNAKHVISRLILCKNSWPNHAVLRVSRRQCVVSESSAQSQYHRITSHK